MTKKKLDTPRPVTIKEARFLKEALRRYRERVDVEISRASERGARRWSRRLVEGYEKAGLLHLDTPAPSRRRRRPVAPAGGK